MAPDGPCNSPPHLTASQSGGVLKVGYMNCRGQSGLNLVKQQQIETFLIRNNLLVLNLQEVHISDDSFNSCPVISSRYHVISNNSPTKYGTAVIVHNELDVTNIQFDSEGRAIVFNVCQATIVNVYLASGSDSLARASREDYCSRVLPQLLLTRLDSGICGGDYNCVIERRDVSHHPAGKISPSLVRMVRAFSMTDCYRELYPAGKAQSRYYQTVGQGPGSSRIDRCYRWGPGLQVTCAEYLPISFSDHMAHVLSFSLPAPISQLLSPRSRPVFKIRPEVIHDLEFQRRLSAAMQGWLAVKDSGVGVLTWWEELVKKGVRKIALERGKEMNWERRGALNLLFLRQSYLGRQLHSGMRNFLEEYLVVQSDIQRWYEEESSKIILQARTDECSFSEKVRIYHHELHRKRVVKSSILKLQTELGLLEGHEACSRYLESKVEELLLTPLPVHQGARDALLAEVTPVFTTQDNAMLEAPPTLSELKEVVGEAHHLASPGTDGIPSLLYHVCWDVMGPPLLDMVQAIFSGGAPTTSQRTSMMVFGAKPKYPRSLDPGHKRRISLINSDMKLVTGIDARRFHKTATHTLSPLQLVAGSDRRIHHGICRARDAILAAGRRRDGSGLLDTDFEAGFDFLVMEWIYLVLLRKGCSKSVVNRLQKIYSNNSAIVVVNNKFGKKVENIRGALKQGDIPSMYYFSVGLDPLLNLLERSLQGIEVFRLPEAGPAPDPASPGGRPAGPGAGGGGRRGGRRQQVSRQWLVPPGGGTNAGGGGVGTGGDGDAGARSHVETYKLCAYADDVKCAISCMNDFFIVIEGCTLLEKASGVRLHRSLHRDKVKFLALGRWRGTLQQEDMPYPFIKLSDSLDFIGVTLMATFSKTRQINCEIIERRVSDTVNPWCGGKFQSIVERGHSVNCYAYSKAFFRCASIPLRKESERRVQSAARTWMFQDCFEKPSALVMHRDPEAGGLGLFSITNRALAMLLRTFCELAAHPQFTHSVYLAALYSTEVLGEWCGALVPPSPYYTRDFFSILRHYHQQGSFCVATMTIKQWTCVLTRDYLTHSPATLTSLATLLPVRCEVLQPQVDWPRTWQRARLRGLPGDLADHLFRHLHGLLPSQDRVARLGGNRGDRAPGVCRRCLPDTPDSLLHSMFLCSYNSPAVAYLLMCLQPVLPGVSISDLLLLNFDLTREQELPVITLLATSFFSLWISCKENKPLFTAELRACLLLRCHTLQHTRRHQVSAGRLRLLVLDLPP